MDPVKIDALEECIARAIRNHLSGETLDWPQLVGLDRPVLRVEAFLEDAGQGVGSSRARRVASRSLDLSGMVTPISSQSPTSPLEHETSHPSQHIPETGDSAGESSTHDDNTASHNPADSEGSRRRGIGGLRISQSQAYQEDMSEHQRRMALDNRTFPKRRKIVPEKLVFQPSTLDKLIVGIWEQIHGTLNLDPQAIFEQSPVTPAALHGHIETTGNQLDIAPSMTNNTFNSMNIFCRKVTQASRVSRSIEIIVQARWTEFFDEQVQLRMTETPQISAAKHRKAVFMEACQDFGWSEKELRNKMAIWKGYKEVKDAAGWVGLIFTGMGIYRFCKYRVEFNKDAMRRLQNLRKRLEVGADTLHPNWRRILSIVGVSCQNEYTGHPHDWVVFEDGRDPVSLRSTYLDQDAYFDFEQIEESVIDERVWGCEDPRWIPQPPNAVVRAQAGYNCAVCGEQQSDDPRQNACSCFPRLFGCLKRVSPPVQIYRTCNGKNNGLQALVPFERGAAIGEFVGLITKGVRHLDVMDGATGTTNYQIWQGRQGNFTRFINHSCLPNSQFSHFTWLDTQRIVLVSKGIEAGTEITVDYGDKYWAGLDKKCLCGESCCRYKREK
ncbi:SET domain-containing protein [Periconia macrospinosa]|uniref:SET domain-containing protein n=1 Tax=Periconia macrospinosa TaxID=97972 RepID=A0A2V1DFG3_9PLEO|nr:SET domain-containing protein [Periconia macrospinosa]